MWCISAVSREDIDKLRTFATSIATTVAGASTAGTGGGISIRGARSSSTWVYIDGIKVRGSSALPKSAIEEVQVVTGGIPANIGDATGGTNICLETQVELGSVVVKLSLQVFLWVIRQLALTSLATT